MANRFEATVDLIKRDRVSAPGEDTVFGTLRDITVKTYDLISHALPAVLGAFSNNSFEVVPRRSAIDGTKEAIRSTLKARWFPKGNLFNVVPKFVTGFMEGTDGVVHDLLHMGKGNQNGSVLRTVD